MPKKLYLIGQTFGRLKVIAEGTPYICPKGDKYRRYECLCECGKTVIVRSCNLLSGQYKSCGCYKTDLLVKKYTKHNQSNIIGKSGKKIGTPTYNAWKGIIKRCTNPNDAYWKDYGGRGITFCERWKDFNNFLLDMGEKPFGKSIDRIDNSKGYDPNNCRWATQTQQMRNTRRNRIVTVRGITAPVAELCEIFHISYHLAWNRLRRGLTPEAAFLSTKTKPDQCNRLA